MSGGEGDAELVEALMREVAADTRAESPDYADDTKALRGALLARLDALRAAGEAMAGHVEWFTRYYDDDAKDDTLAALARWREVANPPAAPER